MWVFNRQAGHLVSPITGASFPAYSGHSEGVDNPADEEIKDVGPIPAGIWDIHSPINTDKHGPYVLPLTPWPQTRTYGRDGFLCHGDSKEHPGEASLGCVIVARAVRELIWNSGDHVLKVI